MIIINPFINNLFLAMICFVFIWKGFNPPGNISFSAYANDTEMIGLIDRKIV